MNEDEREVLNDPFYSFKRYFDAINLFNDFVKRMNNGTVKNDGSDELLSIIDKYVLNEDSNPFRVSIPIGQKFYRARVVKSGELDLKKGFGFNGNDLVGFNETESREPPLGLSCPGRNNIKGASFLYLADRVATACAEVKPGIRQIISLAEFETVDSLRVIDFHSKKRLDNYAERINLNRLFTEIMGIYCLPIINDEEYYASQYLSDYVRKTGVDGISYSSYYDDEGVNYTMFNSDHRKIKFCGSKLMLFQSESKCFLDLNDNKVIYSNSVGGKIADVNTTIKIRNGIVNALAQNSKEMTDN